MSSDLVSAQTSYYFWLKDTVLSSCEVEKYTENVSAPKKFDLKVIHFMGTG